MPALEPGAPTGDEAADPRRPGAVHGRGGLRLFHCPARGGALLPELQQRAVQRARAGEPVLQVRRHEPAGHGSAVSGPGGYSRRDPGGFAHASAAAPQPPLRGAACALVAAVLPGDAITMLLETLPLYLLFELSVLAAAIMQRARAREAGAEVAALRRLYDIVEASAAALLVPVPLPPPLWLLPVPAPALDGLGLDTGGDETTGACETAGGDDYGRRRSGGAGRAGTGHGDASCGNGRQCSSERAGLSVPELKLPWSKCEAPWSPSARASAPEQSGEPEAAPRQRRTRDLLSGSPPAPGGLASRWASCSPLRRRTPRRTPRPEFAMLSSSSRSTKPGERGPRNDRAGLLTALRAITGPTPIFTPVPSRKVDESGDHRPQQRRRHNNRHTWDRAPALRGRLECRRLIEHLGVGSFQAVWGLGL